MNAVVAAPRFRVVGEYFGAAPTDGRVPGDAVALAVTDDQVGGFADIGAFVRLAARDRFVDRDLAGLRVAKTGELRGQFSNELLALLAIGDDAVSFTALLIEENAGQADGVGARGRPVDVGEIRVRRRR